MKSFSRLKDFLEDGEANVPLQFAYSATLRISGDGLPFEEIEKVLKLQPSIKYHKGESRARSTAIYKMDMWAVSSPLSEDEPLEKHLDWLWENVGSSKEYLKSLKNKFHVDIFAGYRSNCDHAGIEIPFKSMKIYYELEIPFGISIIVL